MIEIKKGDNILKVSKASYKDIFQKIGYEIVETEEVVKTSSVDTPKNDENKKSDIKNTKTGKVSTKSKKALEEENDDVDKVIGIMGKNK